MRGGSVPILLAAIVATACIASALLCAAVPCTAGDIVTIQLLTGAGGTPCAQDPNVKFTSPSVLTPQPAVVGTGAPADPCAVMDFLHLLGESRAITTTNNSDTMAVFTIQFDLPPSAGNPSLNLTIWADNWAVPYLNSHWLGAYPCGNAQSSVSTVNPTYFRTGTNTLAIAVYNGPNCSDMGPRSGPDDAMNLQFEGTVTYDPPPAGGGLNLGWQDCGSVPGTDNRNFACHTNTGGVHTLVGSFLASSHMVAVTGLDAVIDAQSEGSVWPDWWNIRVGGCRVPPAMTTSFDFTAGPFSCYDYWQAGAVGAHQMNVPVGNRTRILVSAALPSGDSRLGPILEGTEVYAFKLNVTNAKTVGLGSCSGCLEGVCFVLQFIRAHQTGSTAGSKYISSPAHRSHVTWQGGAGADCYAATPAKNVTWGSIKSRYR